MTSPTISAPVAGDAAEWFDFVVEQQARTYAGIVRPDFAEVQRGFCDERLADLAAGFADPGTARRLLARHDGRVVGVVSITDAPHSWETDLGLVPPPAGRCLDRLYLHPEFQGQGLGSKLLDAVDDGRDLYLWLVDGNTSAQSFYRRRGFVDEPQVFTTGESWGNAPTHRMMRLADPNGASDA